MAELVDQHQQPQHHQKCYQCNEAACDWQTIQLTISSAPQHHHLSQARPLLDETHLIARKTTSAGRLQSWRTIVSEVSVPHFDKPCQHIAIGARQAQQNFMDICYRLHFWPVVATNVATTGQKTRILEGLRPSKPPARGRLRNSC